MRVLRALEGIGIVTVCLWMALPLCAAETPQTAPPSTELVSGPLTAIPDVELDETGSLHGLVVNTDGVPVSLAAVSVTPRDGQPLLTHTDALGQFRVAALRGGLYQVAVGQHTRSVRAWACRTAPPHARGTMLLVVVGDVARGQMPARCLVRSDTVMIGGLVAAMSSIPIALFDSDDEFPVTP
ncbi:MAG: hypothetical protein KJZ87_07200 [Thermoguttaceae bacterium]|nr:hypothetical protein [Thermoguttaceae bacterium]